MRKITIVGAGHAGLQLGIGLLRRGYDITVATNRTPGAVLNGPVTSSQLMFGEALSCERDLGLNRWDDACPPFAKMGFAVASPAGGARLVDWHDQWQPAAQSVDQRIKFPEWMAAFEELGGRLTIETATMETLEGYAKASDLVIVAGGKGEITRIFERDAERSPFDRPMRSVTLLYVNGIGRGGDSGGVVLIPTVGEIIWYCALTRSGPCHIMNIFGVPRGPFDELEVEQNAGRKLNLAKALLHRYLPTGSEDWRRLELTDANGLITGRITPTVRRPVARLPSGALVLGIADAVVLNDPVSGQGSNNASKAAHVYEGSIAEHGDREFDETWMQKTFDAFWSDAQWSVALTNAMLGPAPPHLQELFGAAQGSAALRRTILGGFQRPASLFPWLGDSEATRLLIRRTLASV